MWLQCLLAQNLLSIHMAITEANKGSCDKTQWSRLPDGKSSHRDLVIDAHVGQRTSWNFRK
jgi:hypothetical protein